MGVVVGDEIYIEALENTGTGKINSGETIVTITEVEEMRADVILIDPPIVLPPLPEISNRDFNESIEEPEEPEEIIPAEPGTRKPAKTYNVSLEGIRIPTGIPILGMNTPIQIELRNDYEYTLTFDIDVSITYADNTIDGLGVLTYNIPPSQAKKRTIIWEPQQTGLATITVEANWPEGGQTFTRTFEQGFHTVETKNQIVTYKNGKIVPPPKPELQGVEIEVPDQDLIIGPSQPPPFDDLTLGTGYAFQSIEMENTNTDPAMDGFYKIEVEAGGVLKVFEGGHISRHPDTIQPHYQFHVYGTLEIGSYVDGKIGGTVEDVFGDKDNLDLPGGIIIYPGATVKIENSGTVQNGWTHNIFIKAGTPVAQISIDGANIIRAGDGGGGHGIVVEADAIPIINGNTFTENLDYGLYMNNNREGLIISANTFNGYYDDPAGIFYGYTGIYSWRSDSTYTGNIIDGCAIGIDVRYTPSPTIGPDNEIRNCIDDPTTGWPTETEGVGIFIDRSSPTITSNTIDLNRIGIYVKESSSPTISDNPSISSNSYAGILFQTKDTGTATILNNPYIDNNNIGIFITRTPANIDGNYISSSQYFGIRLSSSTGSVTNNDIYFNPTGVMVFFSSAITLEGNTIEGTADRAQIGIRCSGWNAIIVAQNNNIIRSCDVGVLFLGSEGSTVSGNVITDNNFGISFDVSSATVNGNNIITSNEVGIFCTEDGWRRLGSNVPIITGNTITGNAIGVAGAGFSKHIISNNLQISGNDYGIVNTDCSPLIMDNLDISSNTWAGIYSDSSTPVIEGNTITGNDVSDYGIYSFGNPSSSLDCLNTGYTQKWIISPYGGVTDVSDLLIPKETDQISASISLTGYWMRAYIHQIDNPNPSHGFYIINTTDYDTNGDIDIMASESGTGADGYVMLWENSGASTFSNVYNEKVANSFISAIASSNFNDNVDSLIDFVIGTVQGEIVYLERIPGSPVLFNLNPIRAEDGNFIYSITAGDFDEDGHDDFFASFSGDTGAIFYKGDGSGGFSEEPSKKIETNAAVQVLSSINLDGDVYPEILVSESNLLHLYDYESGTQTFEYEKTVVTEAINYDVLRVSVGDINGDSYTDILTYSKMSDSRLNLYLNNQASDVIYEATLIDGGFRRPIACLDLDYDGEDEMIEGLGLYMGIFDVDAPTDVSLDIGNDGSIEWQYTATENLVGVVDICDDCTTPKKFHEVIQDYLIANTGDTYGRVTVPFALSSSTTGRLILSNIDIDWNLEVNGNTITSNLQYGIYDYETPVSIESNSVTDNGNGIYLEREPTTEVTQFADGDIEKLINFQAGGTPDIIPEVKLPKESRILDAQVRVTGAGMNSFAYRDTIATDDGTYGEVMSADFDGDQDADLIFGGTNRGNTLEYYTNDGTGNFIPGQFATNTAVSTTELAPADFDGDGDIDFLFSTKVPGGSQGYYGLVEYYENDGSGVFTFVSTVDEFFTEYYGPLGMAPADFDGDGDTDVIFGFYQSGNLMLYENDGTGYLSYRRDISPQVPTLDDLSTADYDNDGDYDLIVANWEIHLYSNNGFGWFSYEGIIGQIPGSFNLHHSMTNSDFDLDGDFDFVVSEGATSASYYFTNEGDFNFVNQGAIPYPETFSGLTSNDFDLDGDFDLVGYQFTNQATVFIENVFPSINLWFDVGNDGSYEWDHSGELASTIITEYNTDPTFVQALQDYLDDPANTPDPEGFLNVPLALFSDVAGGTVRMSDVKITYGSIGSTKIIGNAVSSNDNIGIELHSSFPYIYDNTVDSNYYIGIGVYDYSEPVIDYNRIIRTPSQISFTFKGIDIGSASAPVIIDNTIEDHGVAIFSTDSSPTATDNLYIERNGYGIYSESSTISAGNNVITDSVYYGFYLHDSSGWINGNQINGAITAMRVVDSLNVDIIGNNIISSQLGFVVYFSTALISGNTATVTGAINPERGILTGGGPVVISDNILAGSGRGSGIFVGNVAGMAFSDVTIDNLNEISGFDYGIDLRANSDVDIDNNIIRDNDLDGIYTGGTMLGNYPIYTITNCEIYNNGGWGMNFIFNAPTNAGTLETDNPLLGANGIGKIHQEWKIVYVCGYISPSGLPTVYNVPMHLTITEADGVTVIYDEDISKCGWVTIPVLEYELLNTGGRIYHTDHTVEAESYGEYFSPLKTQIEYMGSNRPLYIEFDLVEDTSTLLVPHPVPGFPANNYISFPLLNPKVAGQPLNTVENLWNEIVTAGGDPQQIRMYEPGVGWIPYTPGDPLFDIVPDYAYEITHNQPFGLIITGYLPGYRQMDLYDGSNFIGWTTHHTEIRVSTFATLLDPQNLNTVYRWNTISQGWDAMLPADLMYPGKVYWVVVNGDCTLEYAEVNLVDELP